MTCRWHIWLLTVGMEAIRQYLFDEYIILKLLRVFNSYLKQSKCVCCMLDSWFSGVCVQGVPVDGYLHWTISDNWEWADGYCPKFGLVDVDRSRNLTRIPRPSYYLYQQARFLFTMLVTGQYFVLVQQWQYLWKYISLCWSVYTLSTSTLEKQCNRILW